ncbi:MAG TPA: M23 family metallopeptidase [Rhizomicrobium sp.]|jgi:murein DD-endopeptidase MepM/ murein hydrolase activator NlpD
MFAVAPKIALAIPPPPFSLRGSRKQGSLMVGKLAQTAEADLDGKPLSVSPEGFFAFGFEYNQTAPVRLVVTTHNKTVVDSDIAPIARKYEVQVVNGLPEKTVAPSPQQVARIKRENALVAEARNRDTAGLGFTEPFDWPVPGIVSSLFGSQRELNGEFSAPHFGVDIAAPANTPIHAPADGTVVLAEPDFFLTGGTTILDHGHGVFTVYLHQNTLKVAVGQTVKRADVIGLVGMKGRATGPHLHWGLNWFQMKLDPSLSARTPVPAKA